MITKSKLIYEYYPSKFILDSAPLIISEQVKTKIDDYWKDITLEQKKYTNGIILTIDKIDNLNNPNIFSIKKTSFSHYLFCRQNKDNNESICRSIAANILLLTSDNFYVLCKMSNTTSLAGKIKFIGGAVSIDDIDDSNTIDLYGCISREVKEEINEDLSNNLIFAGVIPKFFVTRPNLTSLNVLFISNLSITSIDLKNRFNQYKNNLVDSELSKLVLVKKDVSEINDFLLKNNDSLLEYIGDIMRILMGTLEPLNLELSI